MRTHFLVMCDDVPLHASKIYSYTLTMVGKCVTYVIAYGKLWRVITAGIYMLAK